MNKPFAITLDVGTSRANKTGAWLYHAEEGPEGYEAACNRAQLDTAVGINSVERFLGDEAIRCGWPVFADGAPVEAAPTGNPLRKVGGKRVLVVGAGPSGLSAAYHLTRLGQPDPRHGLRPGAGDSARILDAVCVLRDMEGATPPMLGRRVAVYGGGNTAMDAARTARRLGASEAVVVCRRTRERMPAHDIEVTEALEADSLVLALGQEADLTVLADVPGDMVPAERTVTVAIGHGKKAARAIDAWLRSERNQTPPRHPVAGFTSLNTWYYSDAPATMRPTLDAARRITTFDEVAGGLSDSTARYEARRCMSYGNCFGCDNCYGACPDNAVVKLEAGQYEIDYDYCKGCGICAAECPCGTIQMELEPT